MFVIVHKELFTFNSQVHNYNTRIIDDLHYPQTAKAQFQKGICYMGAKVFNHLPTKMKSMSNGLKNFKVKLTKFLIQNSFYMND
jgi:hypothetical protein